MPKLSYRFRVILENFGAVGTETYELTKQVMDIKRPVPKFVDIPVDVYNSQIHLAGKPSWEAITMMVRDDVNATVQKIVGSQIQKQFDFFEQASARAGNDYKFTLKCQILDGGNGSTDIGILEQWTLLGCYIASADYSKLDYKESSAATISLSILFDNAVQSIGDNEELVGVGQLNNRTNGEYATGISAGSAP
jgi:hypothetical protein